MVMRKEAEQMLAMIAWMDTHKSATHEQIMSKAWALAETHPSNAYLELDREAKKRLEELKKEIEGKIYMPHSDKLKNEWIEGKG